MNKDIVSVEGIRLVTNKDQTLVKEMGEAYYYIWSLNMNDNTIKNTNIHTERTLSL